MLELADALVFLGFTPGTDFEVRDDLDGKGPYIGSWHSSTSQPTQAEIQAAWNEMKSPANILKLEKDRQKLMMQDHASSEIFSVYPIHKQLNITNAVSGYTTSDRDSMVTFIENVRSKCKSLEQQIDAATSIDQVRNIKW